MSASIADIAAISWENEDGSEGATNTTRSLTHPDRPNRPEGSMEPIASKCCAKCQRDLPATAFTADARMSSGLKSYCRDCCRLDAAERYRADPERHRALGRARAERSRTPEQSRTRHLWGKYGLTPEMYASLLAEQEGKCAICGSRSPGGKGDWHVDHCHKTGKVRGLLCAGCNVGIGHLKDDPDRLRAAATYIEKHKEQS